MVARNTKARFITLEGGEGTGKSTQLVLLIERLRAKGIDAVATREPGGSTGAEDIRALLVEGDPGRWTPMTEALLHGAARKDHVERLIRPALDQGQWVVSDRFADSTLAYQGHAQGLGADVISALQDIVIGDFKPDLTLILDLPVAVGLARAASRANGEDRYERMGVEFHERLRRAFLEIAGGEPKRCIVIDADATPDAVAGAIWSAVAGRFGLKP